MTKRDRSERAEAVIEALDAAEKSELGEELRDIEATARRFEAAKEKAEARKRS